MLPYIISQPWRILLLARQCAFHHLAEQSEYNYGRWLIRRLMESCIWRKKNKAAFGIIAPDCGLSVVFVLLHNSPFAIFIVRRGILMDARSRRKEFLCRVHPLGGLQNLHIKSSKVHAEVTHICVRPGFWITRVIILMGGNMGSPRSLWHFNYRLQCGECWLLLAERLQKRWVSDLEW